MRSLSRRRPRSIRARDGASSSTGTWSRDTRTTSSIVRRRAPRISGSGMGCDRSLDSERVFGFDRLVACGVLHGEDDGVLAGTGLRQEVERHLRGYVALGIKRFALLHGGLGLRPQHFAARRKKG